MSKAGDVFRSRLEGMYVAVYGGEDNVSRYLLDQMSDEDIIGVVTEWAVFGVQVSSLVADVNTNTLKTVLAARRRFVKDQLAEEARSLESMNERNRNE